MATKIQNALLKKWYSEYNRTVFNSRLPTDPWIHFFAGMPAEGEITVWRHKKSGVITRNQRPLIRINTSLYKTVGFCKLVLLHEMIHYDLWLRKIDNTLGQGKHFQKEARRVLRHIEVLKIFYGGQHFKKR